MPKAHFLNLTCELEVANGAPSYTAPSYLRKFSQDLETLPLVYATPEDCVLVEEMPDSSFRQRLEEAGFLMPQFITFDKIANAQRHTPTPWGQSPASAFKLKPLNAQWDPLLRPFFSREFAAEISHSLQTKCLNNIIPKEQIAISTSSMAMVEEKLFSWGKIVIKAPYSSSGRGVQMLRSNQINTSIINKTRSIIKQQGCVMLEPLLDVLCDFAYEFEITDGMVRFIGYSSFSTNENGQYIGHQIPFSPTNFPKEAQHLWDIGAINAALDELQASLQASDLKKHYSGYLGVDAFIYRDEKGEIRLQPCLEINLRNNMGIVALHIEKHLAKGSHCLFRIEQNSQVSLVLFDQDLQKKHPLIIDDNKITAGYLPLSPPDEKRRNMAYIIVREGL